MHPKGGSFLCSAVAVLAGVNTVASSKVYSKVKVKLRLLRMWARYFGRKKE